MLLKILKAFGLGFLFTWMVYADASQPKIFWPTPDARFFQHESIELSVQATASGKLESALFGCVRNNGRRFHEGLDLKPIARDRHGEATDPIFAVMDGVITYINTRAGNSSYGRYVVVEHRDLDVPVYTLYAHLAKVSDAVTVGRAIEAGSVLGIMGRSAGGYSIPKQRAHLHFEIGVLKSRDFDSWYQWRKFSGKNHHGIYNGMNLIGMDPVRFFDAVRSGQYTTMRAYIHALPTAFVLNVSTRKIPGYLRRYPALIDGQVIPEELVGWQIEYTWYGLPKKWIPLHVHDLPTRKEGSVRLVRQNAEVFEGNCRYTLVENKDGFQLGKNLKNDLKLIFGFR